MTVRILALVTEAFGGYGGIAQANRDLIEGLAHGKDSNYILVLPRLNKEKNHYFASNIQQERAIKNSFLYSLAALWLSLRYGPFDVIFCGHIFMVPLAYFISKIIRSPCWIHIHGIEAWERPSALVSWTTERAELVTAVSRFTRRQFLGWAKMDPARVRVLPNTVGKSFWPAPESESIKASYGLKGKKVLLAAGRLTVSDRYKGFDVLIKVLPRIVKGDNDLVCVIVGEGDDRGRLETLARGLNIQEHVLFLGKVEREELPSIYRMADLFVLPSKKEGFGIVFLEALASGVPVIAGNQDGSVDALLDGELGQLIDPDSEEELICAISDSLKRAPKPDFKKVERFFKPNFEKLVNMLAAQAANMSRAQDVVI